jgi:hypothetical protein
MSYWFGAPIPWFSSGRTRSRHADGIRTSYGACGMLRTDAHRLTCRLRRDVHFDLPIRPEMLADGLQQLIAEMLVLAYTLIAMHAKRSCLPLAGAGYLRPF